MEKDRKRHKNKVDNLPTNKIRDMQFYILIFIQEATMWANICAFTKLKEIKEMQSNA